MSVTATTVGTGRVLVLGGTGVLGRHVAAELHRVGIKTDCVGRGVDAADPVAVRDRARAFGATAAIVLSPTPPGAAQVSCACAGLSSVDVGVAPLGGDVVAELARLGAAHVVGVGLVPGLAGLGVRALGAPAAGVPAEGAPAMGTTEGGRVDVLLEQSANATVGPAGIRQMLHLLAPAGADRPTAGPLLRLEHPEADALSGAGLNVRYWTRWDDRGLTRVLGLAAHARLLPAIASLPDVAFRALMRHDPARGEAASLRWRCTGADGELAVRATSDYRATAAVVACVVRRLPALADGVHRPWDVLGLDDVLAESGHVLAPVSPRGRR